MSPRPHSEFLFNILNVSEFSLDRIGTSPCEAGWIKRSRARWLITIDTEIRLPVQSLSREQMLKAPAGSLVFGPCKESAQPELRE
jgi:hypothetical protein